MKKIVYPILFCSALACFCACSDKGGAMSVDNGSASQNVPKSEMKVTLNQQSLINFVASQDATPTPLAPENPDLPKSDLATDLNQIQFFFYSEKDGQISYAKTVSKDSVKNGQVTLQNIPVGTYKVEAVANAGKNDPIQTLLTGDAPILWNDANVLSSKITDLAVAYQKDETAKLPDFLVKAAPEDESKNFTGASLYKEPAQLFSGMLNNENSETIVIDKDAKNNTASVNLKRMVSLMRVQINVNNPKLDSNGFNDSDVDFTGKGASIMIFRLPKEEKIDPSIPVTPDCLPDNAVLCFSSDNSANTVFKESNKNGFSFSRDILVLPNAAKDQDSQYFIEISGMAKAGHKVVDSNSKIDRDEPVFWWGTIKDKFVANSVHEVNLTLTNGGRGKIATKPVENGGLVITVTEQPWDSKIDHTEIDL